MSRKKQGPRSDHPQPGKPSESRAPREHAMLGRKRQPPGAENQPGGKLEEPQVVQISPTLLEQLTAVLRGFQHTLVQVLVLVAMLLMVAGVITLFILAAVLPGAYVGIAALL